MNVKEDLHNMCDHIVFVLNKWTLVNFIVITVCCVLYIENLFYFKRDPGIWNCIFMFNNEILRVKPVIATLAEARSRPTIYTAIELKI